MLSNMHVHVYICVLCIPVSETEKEYSSHPSLSLPTPFSSLAVCFSILQTTKNWEEKMGTRLAHDVNEETGNRAKIHCRAT